MRRFFFGLVYMFQVCLYYADLSVYRSLVITCRERAALLTILCQMFLCVYNTFPYGVSCKLWYLIVPISGHCHRARFLEKNVWSNCGSSFSEGHDLYTYRMSHNGKRKMEFIRMVFSHCCSFHHVYLIMRKQ